MHYRMFHSSDEWLTCADLFDEQNDRCVEITLTIARVFKGKFNNRGKKSTKTAIAFKEINPATREPWKPLGCCIENDEAIRNISGSPNPKNWIGHKVTLFVNMAVKDPGGGTRPGVRIKPFRPDQQRAANGDQQQRGNTSRSAQQSPQRDAKPSNQPARGPAPQNEPHPNAPQQTGNGGGTAQFDEEQAELARHAAALDKEQR